MTYSTQWLELCEAAQAYRIRQYDVLQDKEQLARDLALVKSLVQMLHQLSY
jgi:hypothetical protein